MKRLGRLLMVVLAGGMLAMVYPGWDWAGLVWVWMLPLLWVLWTTGREAERKAGWRGFGYGWLAGAVFFGMNLSWLWTVTVLGQLALAAYLGIYFGLWGAYAATWGNPWRQAAARVAEADDLTARVRRKMEERAAEAKQARSTGGAGWSANWAESVRSLRFAFGNAAWWCGMEWARGFVFTGFGWNGLGVAFHEVPVLAQGADLFGVTGLAFLPVMVQVVVLQTVRRFARQGRTGRRPAHWDFGVAMLVMMLVFVYGAWRLASTGTGESVRLKPLLVQLNIPQDAAQVLWPAEQVHMGYEEETVAALKELEQRNEERLRERVNASEEGEVDLDWPDWIVWPENALTGRVMRTPDGKEWGMWRENWETIHRVREAGDFTMVLGLNELEAEVAGDQLVMREDGRAWNSLVLLPPDDKLKSYPKHHLVIFGEYIPLVDQLPFLKAIYEQQSGAEYHGAFARGSVLEPVPVEIDGVKAGIVPSVCFEDTVGRLQRKFVRPGPQLLVNVTNDGWFKTSAAAAQHFANAKFRAIELRRPLVRCANTGVSAIINEKGSTAHPDGGPPQELRDAAGRHFTRGWMLGQVNVPLQPPWTLYALVGDWPVIVLGILGLLGGWRRVEVDPRPLRG